MTHLVEVPLQGRGNDARQEIIVAVVSTMMLEVTGVFAQEHAEPIIGMAASWKGRVSLRPPWASTIIYNNQIGGVREV